MHYIKRYANRRLYHTEEKQYVTLDRVRQLVESGERVKIVDTKTRKDITEEIVSRWESEEPRNADSLETVRMISNLIYKGGQALGRLADAAMETSRKESHPDAQRLFRWMSRHAERSRDRARNLTQDAVSSSEPVLERIREQVEKSMEDLHAKMNIAPRKKLDQLQRRVAALEKKLREVEKRSS